ncbi:MAG: DUF559 domain-containing protein [Pseudolactococcus laudensis]|uniref:DUF559 domain-containing protein n=1 Tax=Pseudolactococcus laudensis TaxID=1494461 RepID=UPI003F97B437
MIETDKNQILLNMMTDYAKNNPDAIFCYTNAAILYETPRWEELPLEIHTVQSNKKIKNRTAITHIRPYFKKNKYKGFNVITLVDLLLELAVNDTEISAISSISHHLYKNEISVETILNYCQSQKQKSGVAKLRHLVSFASRLDESPFETKVRLKLYVAGVIIPIQQHQVICQNKKKYRVDFLFEIKGRKIILEADGLIKYSSNVNERANERQRESDLIREGYEIMRVMNHDFENGRFAQILENYGIPKRRYYVKKIVKKHY